MSNRRTARVKRKPKKRLKPDCPKCKSTDVEMTEYSDAYLFICRRCKFPRRVKKGVRGRYG